MPLIYIFLSQQPSKKQRLIRTVSPYDEEAVVNADAEVEEEEEKSYPPVPPLPPPPTPTSIRHLTQKREEVIIYDINQSHVWHVYPYLSKMPGGRCHQYHSAKAEEARFMKQILNDTVKFPLFPRRLDGNVIVDSHPEYSSVSPSTADTDSNVFHAILGNYASPLQNGEPIFNEDGEGSCFTMIHLQRAMSSVIPGLTLRLINYSDDILPIQAPFMNKSGQNFCTERDFTEMIDESEADHLKLLRTITMMWVMIDARDKKYTEFRAMVYGKHPQNYWTKILEDAHAMVTVSPKSEFNLTIIYSPHFCSVIHEDCSVSQKRRMDSAVAEFVGALDCDYFCNTDFSIYHRGSNQEVNNVFIDFYRGFEREEFIVTKISSLLADQVPDQVGLYYNRWQLEIVEYVNNVFDCCITSSDITIQHLSQYRGHRGGKSHARADNVKWNTKLLALKEFIRSNDRVPRQRADGVDERRLAWWIKSNKNCGGDREILLRSEVPQIFGGAQVLIDESNNVKWNTKLLALKEFISSNDRVPNQRADGVDERGLAWWIRSNKNCGGDREILLRSEVPQIFGTNR